MTPIIPIVTTTLGVRTDLAEKITRGLFVDKTLTRIGGVVRKVKDGRIVAMLRSVSDGSPAAQLAINSLGQLAQLNVALSVLNLSITAAGFAIVTKKLTAIEQQLASISKTLEAIGRKLDLSFCSNLQAALELARTAFAMTGENNRNIAATQAINRFLEAEHHYIGLIDIEFAEGGWAVLPLLRSQMLATVSASRCYLELGELDTARRHLAEGAAALEPRVQRFYESTVGINPAVFLHHKLLPRITLERMANLLSRESPGISASDVFEKLRQPIWETASLDPDTWLKKLPLALWNHGIDGEKKIGPVKRRRTSDEMFERLLPRLNEAFDQVEQAHVSVQCVRGFESELQFLIDNKISYADWNALEMPEPRASDCIVCLIPHDSELNIAAQTASHQRQIG